MPTLEPNEGFRFQSLHGHKLPTLKRGKKDGVRSQDSQELMTPCSRQQFHLAAVGPRQCHRTSAKKHPCQPPSDRISVPVIRCWNTSDFESLKCIFPSVFHQFQKRTPCIGVCANLLEVVEVATPCYGGDGNRWENPRFQQTQHLKGGNSPRCWVILASEPPL